MRPLRRRAFLAAATFLVAGAFVDAAPRPRARPTERFDVPALDAGISLRVVHRAAVTSPGAKLSKRAVLLVHGAFFPSSTVFDAGPADRSWLARLAEDGIDAYAVDIRGYGGSTRPAFMSQAPGPYVPYASTADAVRDVSAAVAFIRKRTSLDKIDLIGWSWGAAIAGSFATEHPDSVDHLVLYGPGWLGGPAPVGPGNVLQSYRTLTHDEARARLLNGVPPSRAEELQPIAAFERFWSANLALDADGARRKPPVVRAPAGVVNDSAEYWAKGKPLWQPERVQADTLVVVGEWDANTPSAQAQAIYDHLTGARSRKLSILKEGTHFIALETNHDRLFAEVQAFLGRR